MGIMKRLHNKHYVEQKELTIYEKRFLKLAPLKKLKKIPKKDNQIDLFENL